MPVLGSCVLSANVSPRLPPTVNARPISPASSRIFGSRKPFATVLLQLDFTTLLRERARAAKQRRKTITQGAPTNVVACADVRTGASLQDPSEVGDQQAAINGTIAIELFSTIRRERSTVRLQIVQALFVCGIDYAGTPDGAAAKATLISAAEEIKAPVTLAIRSYLTIRGVPVATRRHRRSRSGLGSNRFLNIGRHGMRGVVTVECRGGNGSCL